MNNYPINKQELEFGLTVPMARKAAFHECWQWQCKKVMVGAL
jgi:hypothetical protein